VLDIVRVDLDEAQASLRTASTAATAGDKSAALYRVLLTSARALLPIYGVEAPKDREVFDAFRTRLITPGWVKPQAGELIAAALDWRLGDRASLADLAEPVQELAQRVKDLFGSLDANLKFKLAPLAQTPAAPAAATTPGNKTLDLSGVACPMNFVKAKVALERLPIGATLSVLLDAGEPARNVPASFAEQGQEVVSMAPEGARFRLQVRRLK
jgi:sulfite reductase (ferredoxin)